MLLVVKRQSARVAVKAVDGPSSSEARGHPYPLGSIKFENRLLKRVLVENDADATAFLIFCLLCIGRREINVAGVRVLADFPKATPVVICILD